MCIVDTPAGDPSAIAAPTNAAATSGDTSRRSERRQPTSANRTNQLTIPAMRPLASPPTPLSASSERARASDESDPVTRVRLPSTMSGPPTRNRPGPGVRNTAGATYVLTPEYYMGL
jgi:hypothetical protein